MLDHIEQFSAMVDDRYARTIATLAEIIEKNDKGLVRSVQKTMSNDSIIYCQQGIMKYAITCHNKHISLHLMPIYCYSDIHTKYKLMIKTGKFQKGCVNFSDLSQIPYDEIGMMVAACAAMPYPTQYQLDRKLK